MLNINRKREGKWKIEVSGSGSSGKALSDMKNALRAVSESGFPHSEAQYKIYSLFFCDPRIVLLCVCVCVYAKKIEPFSLFLLCVYFSAAATFSLMHDSFTPFFKTILTYISYKISFTKIEKMCFSY